MTWQLLAGIVAALAVPMICKFAPGCDAVAFDKLTGLSMAVIVGLLGLAVPRRDREPPK